MNITSALIPIAGAAIDTVVQGVSHVLNSDALKNGNAFTRLLHGASSEDATSPADVASTQAESGPEKTDLGSQLEREALRQSFESLRESVHEQLMQRFAEQGVDLSEPAILSLDGQGRLLEMSGHWDRGRIEELLHADPQLRSEIARLLQQGEALHGAGPWSGENDAAEGSRLVVGEKEAFFQVV